MYIKAVEIIMSSPDLPNIFVRLSGFPLLMSYMGSLRFIMTGSGLESMWGTVYTPNSIQHMLTGHAYSRALRAHILSSAAISSVLLETPGCLTWVNIDRLQNIKEELLDSDGPPQPLERGMSQTIYQDHGWPYDVPCCREANKHIMNQLLQ